MEFIESVLFTKYVYNYISDDEYSSLQRFLSFHPKNGDLIPGGGGLRKIRWQAQGKGKRGGIRIIYYFVGKRDEIWFLSIYAKNELTDISKEILAQLKKEIKNA